MLAYFPFFERKRFTTQVYCDVRVKMTVKRAYSSQQKTQRRFAGNSENDVWMSGRKSECYNGDDGDGEN